MKNINTSTTGIGLVILGIVFFTSQLLDINGFLIVPLVGIGFIAWSINSQRKGLMIPGGTLLGLGLGSILTDSTLANGLSEIAGNGLFLLGFAAGWLAINILTLIFFDEFIWWPLIPAMILCWVGGKLLGNVSLEDNELLNWLSSPGSLWPLIPIIIGLSIVWKEFASSVEDISNSLK